MYQEPDLTFFRNDVTVLVDVIQSALFLNHMFNFDQIKYVRYIIHTYATLCKIL